MLRPEEMTRVVIVGSIDGIDDTIECLYETGALHLIDFTKQDQDFKLGRPLSRASDASQKLVKLRSMIRSLDLEDLEPDKKFSAREIDAKLEQAIVTLDLNTSGKVESRQRIQALIREREGEVSALVPIRSFGIPVEDYDGFESVTPIVGVCKEDPEEELSAKLPDIQLFEKADKGNLVVAIFVLNEEKQAALKVLSSHGFSELKIPKLKGLPKEIISKNLAEIKDLEADLSRIDADLLKIKKNFADFIIASEENLSIEVLKAETPLRIAESENSFVIDGWVPKSSVEQLDAALEGRCCGAAFIEAIPSEKEEEPPVRLKNAGPVKPFEMLVSVVSTPKYEEIDPSIVMFIVFPLFFGFMLGDLGFGGGLIAAGLLTRWKFKDTPSIKQFGTIVLAGGLMAAVFGLFVYGEAFGVPFHPPPASPDEASWATVVNIPLTPLIHKLTDIKEMLAISIVAGWVHLTLGLLFGFVNNYHHSRKHALGKIAWILLLFGIFYEMMAVAKNATNTSQFLNSTVFAVFPSITTSVIGTTVSIPAVMFAIVGIIALPITEGPIALSEVLSMFSNLVSYARLAALAVGKGAMALAFNSMLFPVVFGPNIALGILGAVALGFTLLFFVFFLGSLSVGIQAVRLNYVEFFLKFFQGGGTDFNPLRYLREHTTAAK
jgi:V/A-type H+-transporting ATPase subunit I